MGLEVPMSSGKQKKRRTVRFRSMENMKTKPTTKSNKNSMFTVSTANSYDSLSEEGSDSEMECENIATNMERNNEPEKAGEKENRPVSKKFPIFYIHADKQSDLIKGINKVTASNPSIRITNKHMTVKVTSQEDNEAMKSLLEGEKIEYYTYGNSDTRPVKIVINHCPRDATLDDIKAELQEKGVLVHALAKLNSKYDNQVPAIRLTTDKQSAPRVYNLVTLCGVHIKTHHYKNFSIPQCHNCQGFGHSSFLCKLKPKCVACAGPHSGKCQMIVEGKSNKTPAKCANCNGQHPASYKGCPIYKQAREQRQQRQQKQERASEPRKPQQAAPLPNKEHFPALPPKENAKVSASQNLKQACTYAEKAAIKPQTDYVALRSRIKSTKNTSVPCLSGSATNNVSPSGISEIFSLISELKELFGGFDVSKILEVVKKTINKIKSCENKADKLFVLLDAVSEIFS